MVLQIPLYRCFALFHVFCCLPSFQDLFLWSHFRWQPLISSCLLSNRILPNLRWSWGIPDAPRIHAKAVQESVTSKQLISLKLLISLFLFSLYQQSANYALYYFRLSCLHLKAWIEQWTCGVKLQSLRPRIESSSLIPASFVILFSPLSSNIVLVR